MFKPIVVHLIIILHLVFSSILLGIFLFKQFIQYPLFRKIGRNQYPVYVYHLKKRLQLAEITLLIAEGITALMLFISPPELAKPIFFQTNLMLLAMVWIYKYQLETEHLIQLNTGFSLEKHRKLIRFHFIPVTISIFRVIAFTLLLIYRT